MNTKQQIEEHIKDINSKIDEVKEIYNKIKQLESQHEEDLKPGDICECITRNDEICIKYYCGKINNEKRFSFSKEKINKPHLGVSATGYKKLHICNHKVIGEYWMATDTAIYDNKTYVYRNKPKKEDTHFDRSDHIENSALFIGKNINNQTFDDEPVKVYLVIEET